MNDRIGESIETDHRLVVARSGGEGRILTSVTKGCPAIAQLSKQVKYPWVHDSGGLIRGSLSEKAR